MESQTKPETASGQETPPAGTPVRRWWRYWALGIAVAIALDGSVAAWRYFSTPTPVRYITTSASRGDVTRAAVATGTVNPTLTIIVGSYVSGVIQSLSCDYNTIVKTGQICAKVDSRPYQATLNQYMGQLARDRAILARDRANLARYRKLQAQDSIARQQVEDQAYLVQQDEGTVALDEGLVESAKLNLEYTNIVSPVDGTVVSRNVTQGQTVAASFQTPTLFLIAADLQQMQVDANVSESDVGSIDVGDNARFTVDAYPKRTFRGTVTQIRKSPQTVQNVVTYDVVVHVDNFDLALMPGMTASTQIIVNQKQDVLRVADQALRYAPGGTAPARAGTPATEGVRIWVLREGKPVPVAVVTGLDDGNFTEIVRGDLRPDDQVITAESTSDAAAATPQPRL